MVETLIVDGGLGFILVPWQPVLNRRIGQHITGVTCNDGSGIKWNAEQGREFGGDSLACYARVDWTTEAGAISTRLEAGSHKWNCMGLAHLPVALLVTGPTDLRAGVPGNALTGCGGLSSIGGTI
jgi:hypothetical protein